MRSESRPVAAVTPALSGTGGLLCQENASSEEAIRSIAGSVFAYD
jgi:hypothetical protein